MTTWTSLDPVSVTVAPGAETTVILHIRNNSDVVEEYRISPVGEPARWLRMDQSSLRLFPGTSGQVTLTVEPPRSHETPAGPHPYAVQVTPSVHTDAVSVPEGLITVTPFTEIAAELVPQTTRGRLRGRTVLAVDNLGNTRLTASVAGKDTSNSLGFDLRPSTVQIEPGRAVFVRARVKPARILWSGRRDTHLFTLGVQGAGAEPVSTAGRFVQSPVLPRWLALAGTALGAVAMVFVGLWFGVHPGAASSAVPTAAGEPSSQPIIIVEPTLGGPAGQPGPATTTAAQVAPGGAPSATAGAGATPPHTDAPAPPAKTQAPQTTKTTPTPAPTWSDVHQGPLMNVGDGLALDLDQGHTANGTVLLMNTRASNLTGQTWNFWLMGTTYFFTDQLDTRQIMDENVSAGQAQLWQNDGPAPNQTWYFMGTSQSGAYYVCNKATNGCLTAGGEASIVTLSPAVTGDTAQMWTIP